MENDIAIKLKYDEDVSARQEQYQQINNPIKVSWQFLFPQSLLLLHFTESMTPSDQHQPWWWYLLFSAQLCPLYQAEGRTGADTSAIPPETLGHTPFNIEHLQSSQESHTFKLNYCLLSDQLVGWAIMFSINSVSWSTCSHFDLSSILDDLHPCPDSLLALLRVTQYDSLHKCCWSIYPLSSVLTLTSPSSCLLRSLSVTELSLHCNVTLGWLSSEAFSSASGLHTAAVCRP